MVEVAIFFLESWWCLFVAIVAAYWVVDRKRENEDIRQGEVWGRLYALGVRQWMALRIAIDLADCMADKQSQPKHREHSRMAH